MANKLVTLLQFSRGGATVPNRQSLMPSTFITYFGSHIQIYNSLILSKATPDVHKSQEDINSSWECEEEAPLLRQQHIE